MLTAVLGFVAAATVMVASPVQLPLTDAERSAVGRVLDEARLHGEALPLPGSDDQLLRALEIHAATAAGQRIVPPAVDPFWSIAPPHRDIPAEIAAARASGRLVEWARGLEPAAPRYQALLAARGRYAAMTAAGGWQALPPSTPQEPPVAALRVRLAAEGYLAEPVSDAPGFDKPLKQALMAFQSAHGLTPDGALGPRTRTELDIPAEARLAQIDANLERWRWLPALPSDRIEVDIAGAEAVVYRGGQPRLSMRAVVGDPDHRTPMFVSRLESVVINPPWTVPSSIAAKELLPKEAAHPGYLARNDFHFVDGQLQQRPGAKNALGRLKFDLPSPFGVYLHDTPSHSAFARDDRALSHGCMRLERPRDLAALLLEPKGWTSQAIDIAIADGRTLRVGLPQNLPLYVLYWTARAEPDGRVAFRRDVYGWDRKLLDALAAAAPTASSGAAALCAAP